MFQGIPQRKIEYKQDAGYRFDEPAVKESQDEVEFYPVHFLRTHSKNNDPADVQTQVSMSSGDVEKWGWVSFSGMLAIRVDFAM